MTTDEMLRVEEAVAAARAEADSLRALVARYWAALEQAKTVCDDNLSRGGDAVLTLKFVRQVVANALLRGAP